MVQPVGHRTVNADGVGSNPTAPAKFSGSERAGIPPITPAKFEICPSPKRSISFGVPVRCTLIPQRLAGLEGVGDALLRFAFAAEGDEGFALQVEDVLLADELR